MKLLILLAVAAAASAAAPECKDKPAGFYPDLYNCANYFHCDAQGNVDKHTCPDGQWYDRNVYVCNYKESVTSCVPKEDPEKKPDCPPEGIENFAIPGKCSQYHMCVDGVLHEMSCGVGTEFDEVALQCRKDTEAICNKCPLEDVPGELVFLPNKEDCGSYFLCKNREQRIIECDKDPQLHYSEQHNHCLDPALAKCPYKKASHRFQLF